MSKKKIVIASSRPCGGKGTVAKFLVKEYGYYSLPMGELLIQAEKDNNIPAVVTERMKMGFLAPDEIVIPMSQAVLQAGLLTGQSLVLDGVLRTVEQVQALLLELWRLHFDYDLVHLFFDTAEDECRRRCSLRLLEEKRCDDNPVTFENRLVQYDLLTARAIDLIEKMGVTTFHIKVGYARPKEEVIEQVRRALGLIS